MDYRLFFMDSQSHILDVVGMEFEDDDAAMRAAEGYADGRAMELWRLGVHIKTFPTAPPATIEAL